jgi:hypothetical protein
MASVFSADLAIISAFSRSNDGAMSLARAMLLQGTGVAMELLILALGLILFAALWQTSR